MRTRQLRSFAWAPRTAGIGNWLWFVPYDAIGHRPYMLESVRSSEERTVTSQNIMEQK
jgi:hypothetical protein